jgi:hypothetical protein
MGVQWKRIILPGKTYFQMKVILKTKAKTELCPKI